MTKTTPSPPIFKSTNPLDDLPNLDIRYDINTDEFAVEGHKVSDAAAFIEGFFMLQKGRFCNSASIVSVPMVIRLTFYPAAVMYECTHNCGSVVLRDNVLMRLLLKIYEWEQEE